MSFFEELKRRNVIRVGIAYVVVAWLVAQVAGFAIETFGAPDWVLKIFVVFLLLGFPLVVLFAWAFEMTPEGLKREKDVDRSQSITRQTGRKLDYTIIGFLVLVIVLLGIERIFFADKAEPAMVESAAVETETTTTPAEAVDSRPSIAVLPFVNMSSDPEQEYFADGISEEILNSLARVSGLKVAGRTSSFAFKGQNQDLRLIGEALGVQHILEGSVRKQGERVRITAQLVKAEDGFHLWSDTYDRTLEDIFAIQDEIASAILQQTRIQLLADEAIESTRSNPVAYQNYVAAKQRIHERTKAGLEVALKLLEDAVALDPGFASAWAQLGVTTLLLSDGLGSYGDIPDTEAQVRGREHLEKALALDADNAEALAGMGLYWQNQPPISAANFNRAHESLQRSLALDPAPIDTSHWLGRSLQFLGREDEAQVLLEEMVARDPLYWPAVNNLVFLYARKNQLAKAHELSERTMRYRPDLPFRQRALLFGYEGRYAEALPLAQETFAARSDPLTFGPVSLALLGLGDFSALAAMDGTHDDGSRAFALAFLGQIEEARVEAQRQFGESGHPGTLINVLVVGGKYEEAVQLVNERWPNLAVYRQEFLPFTGFGDGIMLDLALAYRRTGDDGRAAQALALARAEHDRQQAMDFDTLFLDLAEASYWSLAGNPDQALEWLSKAVDRGYSIAPRLSQATPQFKELEGLPRYEELQAASLAHMNGQRALLELPPLEAAY